LKVASWLLINLGLCPTFWRIPLNPFRSLAAAVAIGLVAIGAKAATVSFSASNPLAFSEINQTLNLGLFDASLGTLNNVTLQFSGTGSAVIVLTNSSQVAQTVQSSVFTNLLWGSSLSALNSILNSANPLVNLTATTGAQTLAASSSVSFGPLTSAQSVLWDAQLDTIFSAFDGAGPGSFTLNCQSLTGLSLSGGGGNVGASLTSQAGCGAEIIYTYTAGGVDPNPVPEPASLALVGLALGGMAWTRRKVRKV
jgi:hypothetical protein